MLYDNDGIFITGLTGMSGAGKTTACRVFEDEGFTVIDCDIVAREAVGAGTPALAEIASYFSGDVLLPDGTLDRRKLGALVFSDDSARLALNGIIYPYITYIIVNKVLDSAGKTGGFVLLDAPTLFESGAYVLCDKVVCLTADREICAARITERDGITREQALDRLSSQHDAGFYIERSDYSATNNGTTKELEKSLREIAGSIREEHRRSPI